jgi:hypothetical protein
MDLGEVAQRGCSESLGITIGSRTPIRQKRHVLAKNTQALQTLTALKKAPN